MFEDTDISSLIKGNDVLAVIPLNINNELINAPLQNNVWVIKDPRVTIVDICIEMNAYYK